MSSEGWGEEEEDAAEASASALDEVKSDSKAARSSCAGGKTDGWAEDASEGEYRKERIRWGIKVVVRGEREVPEEDG